MVTGPDTVRITGPDTVRITGPDAVRMPQSNAVRKTASVRALNPDVVVRDVVARELHRPARGRDADEVVRDGAVLDGGLLGVLDADAVGVREALDVLYRRGRPLGHEEARVPVVHRDVPDGHVLRAEDGDALGVADSSAVDFVAVAVEGHVVGGDLDAGLRDGGLAAVLDVRRENVGAWLVDGRAG